MKSYSILVKLFKSLFKTNKAEKKPKKKRTVKKETVKKEKQTKKPKEPKKPPMASLQMPAPWSKVEKYKRIKKEGYF